jgi:hypothetical protein
VIGRDAVESGAAEGIERLGRERDLRNEDQRLPPRGDGAARGM